MVASPMDEPLAAEKPRRGRFGIFVLGFIVGIVALFGLALLANYGNF
jgi:hypothetical protein